LGSGKQFSRNAKGLAERTNNPYGPLRDLVRPYILRRMKTDKTIIADLPEQDRSERVLQSDAAASSTL
jgi:non-specific serine/threonine protein kinase